ncbi:MAG TPA: folylpolyglutamate synthase/dihydrofolate synthase family protein [Acidimicrobiales bacterium]|nr:folylpolyglutamate synthase/dihydrofolate synthase family protein [Acidimicrobiales bacterium]
MDWDLADALAYLDAHVNLEAVSARRVDAPTLDRMRQLMDVMAEPQRQYPVMHLTGTNGKTSTARMLGALVRTKGLAVGTYTSPHLERVNERLAWNDEPISDGALAEVVAGIAALEPLLDDRPSFFEILTAAAYRWFADIAIDVAVVEVGLGGQWDATNVADGSVAVVTNVGIDHIEYLGPTRDGIAREKSGIVKPGSTLILGETDPALVPIFEATPAERIWLRDRDFGVEANRLAVGGRLLDLRTPGTRYEEVFLPLHGAHQGDNAAAALAAAEAFFDGPIEEDVVAEAFASVRSPGRMEVVGRQPLCILDGAHNVAGARALAETLAEEFPGSASRVLVVGLLGGRDPDEMLEALEPDNVRLVVACPPPSPRALPAAAVVAAAERAGIPAVEAGSVEEAVDRAVDLAEPDDLVLVTGSLYVVGAARTALLSR